MLDHHIVKKILVAGAFTALVALGIVLVYWTAQGVRHVRFRNPDVGTINFEILSDQMFRFEIVAGKHAPAAKPMESSVMIARDVFPGPTKWSQSAQGFTTGYLAVTVTQTPFCFQVFDKGAQANLGEFCPEIPGPQRLRVHAPDISHTYGLGEQFIAGEGPDLNWLGRKRVPGDAFGNHMVPFAGGNTGNAQFPILYALGKGTQNFALFMDNTYQQTWDFTLNPWRIEMGGGPLRGYLMTGESLPLLRRQFMDLVGRPPVPPRKAFGLWVSEYGFDNWAELEDKLKTLRAAHFPIDGFVLDLQWFGGIKSGSPASPMGGLQWDEVRFPHPTEHLADLKVRGIGIIGIEEPYISAQVTDQKTQQPIYATLERQGFLAMDGAGPEAHGIRLDPQAWWGAGGMIDFTNESASALWHDWRRQPLVEAGFLGHWTDLGEPEMYSPNAFYHHGQWREADVQNIYNLKWSESIYQGYRRHQNRQRPWILSRSGTAGSQRYGVAMWSGDIGSNFESLSAHLRAQAHMSLSGMDYFGSDVGGFLRPALRGDLNKLYTAWFAASTMFDTPVRPHTENLCNCRETAPDRIGDKASNLANLRQRYELIPYYYSLAHRAHLYGDPLIAPLLYFFQDDDAVRDLATQKMIGPWLMAAAATRESETHLNVYLPAGEWYDFHSGEKMESTGAWLPHRELRINGIYQLPLFARAGAIIPEAMLDEEARPTQHLVVQIYPSENPSAFTLFEDDGASIDYLHGEVRRTGMTQAIGEDGGLTVTIDAAKNNFAGSPQTRPILLKVWTDKTVRSVQMGSEYLRATNAPASGWTQRDKQLLVRLPARRVDLQTQFIIKFE